MDSIVIHYSEIALKGANRKFFEEKLIDNIKSKLGSVTVVRESGQLVVQGFDKKYIDALKCIPGIAYFSPAVTCKLDMETIKKEAVKFLKGEKFSTFKVDARRHVKTTDFTSKDLNNEVGEAVIDNYDVKAKMKDPDLTLKVEVSNKNAYLSYEKIQGVGGMPTSVNKKVAVLLSGGMDSPVSAYMMMKRGMSVVLVHFQNRNAMTNAVKGKIEKLAKQLSKFQVETKLYIIPFDELQQEIIANVHSSIRMLVYRKFMAKIAAIIARQEKAKFLVTGDSLSQVSSQTVDNLSALYEDSDMHILSPLVGMNKEEIMNIAKEIGTYDISALPYGDCCSFFMPKHPELKATVGMLRDAEVDIELVKKAIEKAKLQSF